MSRIHVCLVSGQVIPNLIPLLRPDMKPDKVILFVSRDMGRNATRMESILSPRGIEVERRPIDAYDMESAKNSVFDLLTDYEDAELLLNVTGGTKIMAFAAFEMFTAAKRPVVYVDTQNRAIQYLTAPYEKIAFQGIIKIPVYLAAYGQRIVSEQTDRKESAGYREITDYLVRNAKRFSEAIGTLNYYAIAAKESPHGNMAWSERFPSKEGSPLRELLGFLHDKELLEFDGETCRVKFRDMETAAFLGGGWLEDYVFSCAAGLNPAPTDLRKGVCVELEGGSANEYDVVFTRDNTLFMIECKTKRFSSNNGLGADTIYKLDSLKNKAGGLFGKGMLVSYRKLSGELKKRLHENRLHFCDAETLQGLPKILAEWVK